MLLMARHIPNPNKMHQAVEKVDASELWEEKVKARETAVARDQN